MSGNAPTSRGSNPPFLGGKLLRKKLGVEYVDSLFQAWDGEVPRGADLVCYWHEAARQCISEGKSKRAGLLATQGIRGGANQKVLSKIKESGDIFEAWQDEPWVVEGAAVRISIVCQDDGSDNERRLDGKSVTQIYADLTGGDSNSVDLTEVHSNSDVVVPWINGLDVTRRHRDMFIIDFGVDRSELDAAMYAAPFEHVTLSVKPTREKNRRQAYADKWWLHVEPRPAMRKALSGLPRFLVTLTVARHRTFAWVTPPTLPDHQLIVFARADDYFFGVVHSRVHEVWSLMKGTQLEDRPRYTPSSTFETFPFPWPLSTPTSSLTEEHQRHHASISEAAKRLEEARARWLDPPELVNTALDVVPELPPRPLPRNPSAAVELRKRTMTALYNERPGWLRLLHEDLDSVVLAAYGWPTNAGEPELLKQIFRLNQTRAKAAAPLE